MKIALLFTCMMCALPALAADPLADVLACRSISDSAARLACFDRESAALAALPAAALGPPPGSSANAQSPAAAPAAAGTPAPPRPAPLDAQQSFGLNGSAVAATEEAAGARPAKLAKIESKIVGLSLTGNGRTVFTLDNTQVWRQIEADGDMLAKLNDVATVSRGLLGSYWLQLKNGRGCKVTRIR